MHIVYLLPGGLYNPGGMERTVTIKANYLAEKLGYDVSIVTTEQMGRPVFFPLSPKVHLYHLDLDIGKYFGIENYIQKLERRLFKIIEYKRKLSKLLKTIHPDITITTLGGLDIEFINDLKDGSIKIGELHFPHDYRKVMAQRLYHSYFPRLIGHLMNEDLERKCKKLRRLVVLTEEEKTFWSEMRNVAVIPNPLPFTVSRFSTTKNKKAIAVGRLTYEKGFDLLIKAWKKVAIDHPDWELAIFGNGDQKEFLVKSIHENGLDNVIELHEAVDNIQDWYPDYSILIFPTRALEALPMVIIEAMSYGIPVIAFNTASCGPRSLIVDHVNGLLVNAEDVDELTQKIDELIESDDVREAMGHAAEEFAAGFRIEKVMDDWVHLFEELIKEKKQK